MTMEEAIALQPAWVGIWLNWLFFGAFVLPLALLIWKKSRIVGLLTLALSACPALRSYSGCMSRLGYVKAAGFATHRGLDAACFLPLLEDQGSGNACLAETHYDCDSSDNPDFFGFRLR